MLTCPEAVDTGPAPLVGAEPGRLRFNPTLCSSGKEGETTPPLATALKEPEREAEADPVEVALIAPAEAVTVAALP